MPVPVKKRRWWRTAARFAVWTGLGLLGLLALALASLQSTVVRTQISEVASTRLSQLFRGQLELTIDESLGVFGVSGLNVRVSSEDGAPLASLSQVHVELETFELIESLLADGPVRVHIARLSAAEAWVDLATNEQGELRLVEALTPSEMDEPTSAGGPGPVITFDTIGIEHAQVELRTEAVDTLQVDRLQAGLVIQDALRLNLHRAEVQVPLPEGKGTFAGDLVGELFVDSAGTLSISADLHGAVGGVTLTALSTLVDDSWFSVVLLEGDAAAWGNLELGVQPSADSAVEIEAQGDFTTADVSVTARAQQDAASSSASTPDGTSSGTVALVSELRFEPFALHAGIAAVSVDPHAFASVAPVGNVSLDGNAQLAINSPPRGMLALSVRAGEIAGSQFPSFETQLTLLNAESAELELYTTQAPRVELRAAATRDERLVSFEAEGSAAGIPPELPIDASKDWVVSDLELAVKGTYDVERSTLSGNGKLDAERVVSSAAQLDARGVHVNIATEGSLANPTLSGSARVMRLDVAGFGLSRTRLNLRPTPSDNVVQASTRVQLGSADSAPLDVSVAARLNGVAPLDSRDIRLELVRQSSNGPVQLGASIDRVHVAQAITLEGLRASGVGEIGADLKIANNDVEGSVRVESLELARLTQLLAPLVPELSGVITADIAANVQRGQIISGHVYGRARGTRTEQFEIEQLDASLVVEDTAVSGSAKLQHRGSWVRFDALRARSARNAIESGDAQSIVEALQGYFAITVDADARDFEGLLNSALPGAEISGHLDGEVSVLKEASTELDAEWSMQATQVAFRRLSDESSESSPQQQTSAVEEWGVRDLSAEWIGSYRGNSGKLSSALRLHGARDERSLAWFSFSSDVEPSALLQGDLTRLQTTPLSGVLIIPEVKLAELPVGQLLDGLHASVEARVELGGTPADPELDGTLDLTDFSVESLERSLPVTLRVTGAYRQSNVDAHAKVWHEQRQVGRVRVSGELSENTALKAEAELRSIPLQCFPYVRDYGLGGVITGQLDYSKKAGRESFTADVQGRQLLAAGAQVNRANAHIEFKAGKLQAEVKLEEPEGWAKITLRGESKDARLASVEPGELTLAAEEFQVRPLFALVSQPVAEVEGILDGEMRLNLNRRDLKSSGKLSMRDAGFHMISLGEAVRDLRFELRTNGREIQLAELSAKLGDGSIDGEGQARYETDGGFEGRAKFRIPKREPIPISREGLTVAHASGRVDLVASRDPATGVKVGLDVPRLRIEIEQGSERSVQDIEPAESITLGSKTPGGRFVAYRPKDAGSAEQSEPVELSVKLGDDVWIYRGAGTFVAVSGEVRALLSDQVRIRGELNAGEGQLDIMGRVFEVRQGTVALDGESPPNPDIVAEAAWESPSGHTIIAAFRGALSSGKLTLRSEPALSYDGILNVILFDDPEGVGADEGEGSAPASGVAASIAGAGLGRALSDITELDISAGVDTSDEDAPRPELGVRLSPRVAVGVAYNPDPAPSLGQAPDRGIVSLDWRLSQRWTLESSFGDRGSATTDLVWRLRY